MMKDRIQAIIDKKHMSQSQFADTIGVQRSTLHHILSGRNNPSLEVISKIHSAYPDIDLDWIFTGSYKNAVNDADDNGGRQGELFLRENGLFRDTTGISSENASNTNNKIISDGVVHANKSICSDRKITQVIVVYSDGTTESLI